LAGAVVLADDVA